MGADKTLATPPKASTLSFKIFLLCAFVVLGRPQDLLPVLQPFRLALVLTLLSLVAMVFGARRNELSAALTTTEAKRYLLFFAIMVFGIPFAHHRRFAYEGIVNDYLPNVLLFCVLVYQITTFERLKSFVWIICLCTLMYSVFGGLLQVQSIGGERVRLVGQMFDPNDTAFLLVSLFPLTLYFLRSTERLWKRIVATVAFLSAIAMILLTSSRGGVLGLGAILLVLLFMQTAGIGRAYKVLIALALVSTWFLVEDKVDVDRYKTLTDVSKDYNLTSEGGRVALWKEAIYLTVTNPLTGVGVNCFASASYYARLAAGGTYQTWHAAHNSFLQVSADVGLIGFTVFLLMIIRSLRTFAEISKLPQRGEAPETRDQRALGALLVLGFTGLLVTGFFLSQGFSVLFTIYFGLAAAMARIRSASHTAGEPLNIPAAAQGRHARPSRMAAR